MKNLNDSGNRFYEFMKCIWMSSNIIEYKLCDKNFDCENCSFDKVIRNLSNDNISNYSEQPNLINKLLEKLNDIKFDDKIIYLKNCLIAKQIFSNTYFLGINPILISFLDNVSIMMKYKPLERISIGKKFISFIGDWGEINLLAPMNFSIYDKVNNPTDNPMKSKWIAVVGAIQQEISASKLNDDAWNKLYNKSIGILNDIKSSYPKVGITMHDGGVNVNYLHQLVGKEKYLEIINSLFT